MDLGRPPTLNTASLCKQCLHAYYWPALDRWPRLEYWSTQSWARQRMVDVRVVDNGVGAIVGPTTHTKQIAFSDLVHEFIQHFEFINDGGNQFHGNEKLPKLDSTVHAKTSSKFLAQCAIVSNVDDEAAILPELANDVPVPSFCSDRILKQVNLWLGMGETQSAAHYDGHDNVLCVVVGRKIVRVYEPSAVSWFGARPVWKHSSTNHAARTLDERASSNHKPEPLATFVIETGDALFIPEGYWHEVKSDVCTIAVNYWFDGVRALITAPSVAPFYLRSVLGAMVETKRKATLEAHIVAIKARGAIQHDDDELGQLMMRPCLTHSQGECSNLLWSLLCTPETCVTKCAQAAESSLSALKCALDYARPLGLALLVYVWENYSAETTSQQEKLFSVIFGKLREEGGQDWATELVAATEAFSREILEDIVSGVVCGWQPES